MNKRFSRTIDQIYVDDPKKAFKSEWESIAPVVHENQEWKRDMKHVSSRKKFVEEMINIKTGLLARYNGDKFELSPTLQKCHQHDCILHLKLCSTK